MHDVDIYVKKLTSLNPDRFKFVRLHLAVEQYRAYLASIKDHATTKTFSQWLASEI